MKKVLFIDREGTLIIDHSHDTRIHILENLEFYPKVFRNLYLIRHKLDFELVMLTRQNEPGKDDNSEESFSLLHRKMLQGFANEGIQFDDTHMMLDKYLSGDYDLAQSFVIGDRLTDMELAKNLGCKGILMNESSLLDHRSDLKETCVLATTDWDCITEMLYAGERTATVQRKTKETDIFVSLNLNGTGNCDISTGLGFFDHLLEQIGKHSGIDLTILCQGDLHIDEHHTIEDIAIVLGQALNTVLGDKRGIERYGFCLPMDDCLCSVSLDFGGRPWLVWEVKYYREKVGDMPTEMFHHFFKSLSDAAKMNLNIKAEGDNEHHKIEGTFKAFARALKMAVRRDIYRFDLPSTKGLL